MKNAAKLVSDTQLCCVLLWGGTMPSVKVIAMPVF